MVLKNGVFVCGRLLAMFPFLIEYAVIAQTVERRLCNPQVVSSILTDSSIIIYKGDLL